MKVSSPQALVAQARALFPPLQSSLRRSMTSRSPDRHAPAVRALHWLLAGLIIAALVMSAFVMPGIRDDSPEKVDALRRHMAVGVFVLVLTFARLSVRRRVTRPASLSSGMIWADWLARLVHRIFDLLVLAMVASGISMAFLGGVFPAVFGLSAKLPASLDSLPLLAWHRGIGITLFVLLALHVGGALYHQLILRDGLIGRMMAGFARH